MKRSHARACRLTFAVAALVFAGCMRNLNPDVKATSDTTPTGPCRDDENFENGRCAPRIPGGGLTGSAQAPR